MKQFIANLKPPHYNKWQQQHNEMVKYQQMSDPDSHEYFHNLVVQDPLLAAEGMDIDRALEGLNELERAIRAVERESSDGSFMRTLFLARYPIRQHTLPLPFLRSFVESERLRRIYLANPNSKTASELALAWERSSDVLERCARRYMNLHRMFRSFEGVTNDNLFEDRFGNSSSSAYIHNAIASLVRNAIALKAEAHGRQQLLSGGVHPEQLKSTASERPPLLAKEVELSPEAARVHKLETMYGTPFRNVDVLETHGPFRHVLSGFKGVPSPHDFMLYITRDKKTGRIGMEVSRVDSFIFYELADKHNFRFNDISTANYKSLIERGIPYFYEASTHLYTMRDQRYWMDIATIVDMKRRPHLNAGYLQTQRSSMFDLLLDVFIRHAQFNISYARRRKLNGTGSTYSPYRGLLNHSYPSLYYLTFNRSVWRLPEESQFIGDGRVSTEGRPYRSSEEVLPQLTPDMLDLVMQGSRIREAYELERGMKPREEY